VFKLNELYRRTAQVRELRRQSGGTSMDTQLTQQIVHEKEAGREELVAALETINQELNALEQQLSQLSSEIVDHA
jgi:predicted  nucleic acid-binding Zn-ribbon protein